MNLLHIIETETLFIFALLFPILVQVIVLYAVSRGLWSFTGRYFGRSMWVLLALIGVPVHELSHAVAFLLTGAGVQKIVLFAPRGLPEYDGATGVVVPARRPSAFSRLVASIAPFFGCSLAAWLVLRLLLPASVFVPISFPTAGSGISLRVLLDVLVAYLEGMLGAFARLQWSDWRTYLTLYLVASLGMGAAPSREDFRRFFPALIGLFVLLLPVFALLQLFADPARIFSRLQSLLSGVLIPIGSALSYATVFALLVLLALVVLAIPRVLFGRR